MNRKEKADILLSSMLAFVESTHPRVELARPKYGVDYGEVKSVSIKINRHRPKKRNKRK